MVHPQLSLTQVGTLLVLICSITCSTGTVVSIEDRFEHLETVVYQLQEKNIRLEEKVTQLEAKNARLENNFLQQETILMSLLAQKNNQPESAAASKKVFNNVITQSSAAKLNGIPRTCRDLRAADPSLPSGMHWIDPDGQGVGDDPIYVYCDVISGSTSILHDSESSIDVGHCAEPGCYSRFINYNASIRQIKSLIELSAECHQSIKYDCYYAPFEFLAIPYAWWNDRDGIAQYFWAGNNTDGIHTCECGINGNCVDLSAKCNCDAAAPVQLVDYGIITDKNILPITRLNFGRTQLETSSGIHTLGRFECSGSVALTKMPTSCKDLWLIGHALNGFYSVQGDKMMESVYCDFTKLPDDAGFQKWVGFVDIKSAPVYFYVQRNSSFNTTNTPIPFHLSRVNEGNAMDLIKGIFTVPRTGVYFFAFTGLADFPSSSLVYLRVGLYLNGVLIGLGSLDEGNTVPSQNSPFTFQSTLNLKSGDQVWLAFFGMTSGSYLYDDGNHYTHFTGFMLEEEIFATL